MENLEMKLDEMETPASKTRKKILKEKKAFDKLNKAISEEIVNVGGKLIKKITKANGGVYSQYVGREKNK